MASGEFRMFSYKCVYCHQISQFHVKCNLCQIAIYCSEEHQQLDWVDHQLRCNSARVNQNNHNQGAECAGNLNVGNYVYSNKQQLEPMANTSHKLNLKLHHSYPIYETNVGISKEGIIKGHVDYLIQELNSEGYCVIDGLLGKSKARSIVDEMAVLLDSGIMKYGETVSFQDKVQEKGRIRGDVITWISDDGEEESRKNIAILINVCDHLITFCNGRLPHVIKGRTQAMAAYYPGNGIGYKYHIDNPNKDGRYITCLYYANKEWNGKEDGGQLRLYPGGTSSYVDIEPNLDRLVLFWSDHRTPHEVLPPYRQRFAITLWYFDADEREKVHQNYMSNLKSTFGGF